MEHFTIADIILGFLCMQESKTVKLSELVNYIEPPNTVEEQRELIDWLLPTLAKMERIGLVKVEDDTIHCYYSQLKCKTCRHSFNDSAPLWQQQINSIVEENEKNYGKLRNPEKPKRCRKQIRKEAPLLEDFLIQKFNSQAGISLNGDLDFLMGFAINMYKSTYMQNEQYNFGA